MNLFKKTILLILSIFSIALTSCHSGNAGNEEKTITTISINPTTIEMYEEEYAQVTVETNSQKPISFISENSDIASVNSSGVILAKSAGTTIVKATVEDVFASCSIIVKPISEKIEDYIRLEKSLFVIGLNEDSPENIIVPTYYHGSEAVDNKSFEYSTDNQNIVNVSKDGRITALSSGIASITVTCEEASATVTINVYDIVMRTTSDWINMLKTTKNINARFYLDSDLDFSGISYVSYSTYDSKLMGELNGNYHTVSNITMKSDDSTQSIFGFASVFSLSNIRFINVIFTSSKRNGGLFVDLYQHYDSDNKVGQSSINNVLCDFIFSSVTSCVIANRFYGANVDNVYVRLRNVDGNPLVAKDTYLMSYIYYAWYGTSHFINVIGLVENGNITSVVKDPNPPTDGYWIDTITEVKVDVANSLIGANYLASQSFDLNIWDIKPNELPSFVK